MEKDFVIDQASWHTQRIRNYEFDNSIIYAGLKSFINYLQEHNLTTHILLEKNQEVNDQTCFKRSDLTDNGFALVKRFMINGAIK